MGGSYSARQGCGIVYKAPTNASVHTILQALITKDIVFIPIEAHNAYHGATPSLNYFHFYPEPLY